MSEATEEEEKPLFSAFSTLSLVLEMLASIALRGSGLIAGQVRLYLAVSATERARWALRKYCQKGQRRQLCHGF